MHTEFHCGYTYPVNKQRFMYGTWAVSHSVLMSDFGASATAPCNSTDVISGIQRRNVFTCTILSTITTGITAIINVRYWSEKKNKYKRWEKKNLLFFHFHAFCLILLFFFFPPLYGFHKPLLSYHCEIVTSAFYFAHKPRIWFQTIF